MIDGEYVVELRDGTIKQVNPFTGTEVWTVPGRGNRPLGVPRPDPRPLEPGQDRRACAFCQDRYLETPPEKSRIVRVDGGFDTRYWTAAEALFSTVAEFRRVPNLFEILSYEYWHLNYGYELSEWIRQRKDDYLAFPAGREHDLRHRVGAHRGRPVDRGDERNAAQPARHLAENPGQRRFDS